MAALGVVEMVDENMANAARVHAIESGKGYDGRALIAFGGGGPVHACRVAEKIGVRRILVPSGAGVGSAIGFLRAPVAYEVVRCLYQRFATFDLAAVNALLAEMAAEAREAVARGAFGAPVEERRLAYMRYVGQGHEIAVPLPARDLDGGGRGGDPRRLRCRVHPLLRPPGAGQRRGGAELRRHRRDARRRRWSRRRDGAGRARACPLRNQAVRDTATGEVADWPVYDRAAMAPGAAVAGPCIVAEDETSTLVGPGWRCRVDGLGYLEINHGDAP